MTRRERVRVDARGMRCPVPLLLLARAAEGRREGDEIELLGDDPDVERDLRSWCEETGHRLAALSREGERGDLVVARIRIRQGGRAAAGADAAGARREAG